LIVTLPKPGGLQLFREGRSIVMAGGTHGAHTLDVRASNAERLLIHWKGYVENNGQSLGPRYSPAKAADPWRVPVVGQWVSFPSPSAPSGWRKGQVVRVTKKRVLIAFRFNKERAYDERHGLKFDPATARTTWRKLAEIRQ
jgi:hypothetical protein